MNFTFNFQHYSEGKLQYWVCRYKAKGDEATVPWRRAYYYEAHSAAHDELSRRRERQPMREAERAA
jgi:hypothetical protein